MSPSRPSLVALIRENGQKLSGSRAYTWLSWERGVAEPREQVTTWDGVERRARAVAVALQARGLGRGDRALIAAPMGLGYVEAIFGCLMAGVAMIPMLPPHDGRAIAKLLAVLGDAEPGLALTSREVVEAIEAMPGAAEMVPVDWLAVEDVPDAAAQDSIDPNLGPADLAVLQYTSGSTARPKGVMVRHGELLANLGVIYDRFGHRPGSVGLHWLPLFHDMGLVGGVLQPLFIGCANYHMDPFDFIRRPERFLRAIGRYRVTTAGGPNFAYQLCVDRVPERKRVGLDLSSWEVAFCGAEPVRAETMRTFCRAFAPHGFDPGAIHPCYGMAEHTLYVTGVPKGSGLETRRFSRAALAEEGRVEPPRGEEDARELVSCGQPAEGHGLRIVDPEEGGALGQGRVGEVWLRGPSVAGGYWRRPALSEAAFDGSLEGRSGWLRTGDLGFLHEGALYLTGRIKELLKIDGAGHDPADLEETLEALEGLRMAVVFPVDDGEVERAGAVAEVDPRADPDALRGAMMRALSRVHGVPLREVFLVRRGIRRTTSGKKRRAATGEAALSGALETLDPGGSR